MNRAENAGNCGADPHFASRHSLSNAAIEVLENRCLLSQTVVYSYNGPDYTAAPGVTANWYSTPENSVGGNTLKGLNGNTSRPLVLNNLPSHSTISIAFDLVTTGTFSGGNFAVVQRTVGPGPSYTVTHTTRLSDTISHSGTGVTYTRYRVEFSQSDNRLDLQFNMSGVPHNPGSWGIDNVSIVNDRETPEVSIAATTPTTTEGSSAGAVFTVTRTTADEALDVEYTVGGTATNGDDYVALTGVARFLPGSHTAEIVVNALQDNVAESTENVSITVINKSSYDVSASDTASVSIADTGQMSINAQVGDLDDSSHLHDAFGSASSSATTRFRVEFDTRDDQDALIDSTDVTNQIFNLNVTGAVISSVTDSLGSTWTVDGTGLTASLGIAGPATALNREIFVTLFTPDAGVVQLDLDVSADRGTDSPTTYASSRGRVIKPAANPGPVEHPDRIYHIIDPFAAFLNGHSAMLIPDANGGITYYSYSTDDAVTTMHYNNVTDALAGVKAAGYKKYQYWNTTDNQEAASRTAASGYHQTDWKLFGHNCWDMVSSALQASGVNYVDAGGDIPNRNFDANSAPGRSDGHDDL